MMLVFSRAEQQPEAKVGVFSVKHIPLPPLMA
jgi:hypothetical protein